MYAGLAASTRKTYRTAQRKCFNFSEMSGFVHANGSPCPANEWTLCLFAAFLAESINHASIKVYLPSTSSCSPRYQAQSRRQLFYSPSHHCIHLKIIRNSLDLRQHDHLMFWAACCLAFFGFLRSSEFTVPSLSAFSPAVHLTVADIAAETFSQPTSLRVNIKASKTDPVSERFYFHWSRS